MWYGPRRGEINFAKVVTTLAKHPVRQQQVLTLTMALADQGRKVLVLGDRARKGINVVELSSDVDAPFLATATFTLPWRQHGEDDGKPLALTHGAPMLSPPMRGVVGIGAVKKLNTAGLSTELFKQVDITQTPGAGRLPVKSVPAVVVIGEDGHLRDVAAGRLDRPQLEAVLAV